jgi:cell division protein FtsZ
MNRRAFIKSVIALAIAKVSAAQASGSRFLLPITEANSLPNANLPPSSVQEYDAEGHTVIKVIGIGGAGCNAIDHSLKEGVRGVEFIAANTDAHALTRSYAPSKILFDETGLGAGANPETGRIAAEGNRDDIRAALEGAHMVFITAGMGGGTGTGAAPVVAEIARKMGILTIGVVTKPFSFEGSGRLKIADAGIVEMEKHVDSLIVIPNDNLLKVMGDDPDVDECFKAGDDALKNAISSISDIINYIGLVAVDFEDVRTVMGDMGRAMMGYAAAAGVNRSRIAAEQAVFAPLLEGVNLSSAKGILVNITAAKGNLKMKEVNKVMNTVKKFVAEDAHIIFGAVYDERMGDALRVTVVVTGLNKVAEASPVVRRKNVTIEKLTNAGVDRYDIPAFLRK